MKRSISLKVNGEDVKRLANDNNTDLTIEELRIKHNIRDNFPLYLGTEVCRNN